MMVTRTSTLHPGRTAGRCIGGMALWLIMAAAVTGWGPVSPVLAQDRVAGRWEGAINLPGMDLGIIVVFTADGDSLRGTIDIPMQMAKGLPLRDIVQDGQGMRFALQAGPGLAAFAGTLAADSIAGTFTQATVRCPFILRRAAARAAAPPPYTEEEVMIPAGSVTLAGTLSIPPGSGPHPAIILLTGSGAQTRDEDVFGFEVFKVLADTLTRSGFAVLRCDDRGMGGSTGDYAAATTDDFAADARAQWSFLRNRAEIARERIGLLGHSEGALAAGMACVREPAIAFAVFLAGPAVRGDSIILGQILRMARASGAPDSAVAAAQRMQERVFATVHADTGWENLRGMLVQEMHHSLQGLPPAQRTSMGNIDSAISARVDVQMTAIRSAWFRRFTSYDPAEHLRKMACPVLALLGSLDVQVPVEQNRPAFERIFAGRTREDAGVVVIEGANHLFQKAVTGDPREYGSLPKQFIPSMPEALLRWLDRFRR